MASNTRSIGVLFVLTLLAGCSDPVAQTSGTVTLDGKPVENGTIQIYPSGNGVMGSSGITNGRYEMTSSPGEMKVVINANKVVGTKKLYNTPDSPTTSVVQEIIPEKYNKKSELRVTLKPGINSEVNFDLTSK